MDLPGEIAPSGQMITKMLPVLWQVYQQVQQFLQQKSAGGLYEMLEYDATLELLDAQGQTALFKKRQRVKFLQDYVLAFQDHAWGQGNILVDYHCSPGIEVDRYLEGDRWNVLISLRETQSRGDVKDFYIQRKILRGFTKHAEWWQLEMQHQTDWLKLSVIFPRHRHCLRAALFERKRNRFTILGPEHFTNLPDGRQAVTWETKSPIRFETYMLKWDW